MPRYSAQTPAKGIGVRLEVENGRLVKQGLENFAKAVPEIGRHRLYRVAHGIYTDLGIYPSEIEGARYVRTDELRRARKIIKRDVGFEVRNDPVSPSGGHYAVFVRGDFQGVGQTRQHMRTWPSLEHITNVHVANLPEEVLKSLRLAVIEEQRKASASYGPVTRISR